MKYLSFFLLLAALTGCVSTPVKDDPGYPISPEMATAYAGGVMNLSWETETNQIYTVYYTDAPHGTKPNWKPLPQANRLRGTGKQMSLIDKPPTGDKRRYLILAGDRRP